jgi:hypothetical protein
MQHRDLTYLALLVARQAPRVLFAGCLSVESQIEYWLAGKNRLDQWMGLMKGMERSMASDPSEAAFGSLAVTLEGLAGEVLSTEVLSRVWAAISCGCDQLGQRPQLEPLAHSVLMGHLQASERVLRLMEDYQRRGGKISQLVIDLPNAVAGWTDQLIGWISSWVSVTQYAADPERAGEFASEWRAQGSHSPLIWRLLQNVIDNRLIPIPAGPLQTREVNQQVALAILGNLPRECVAESEFAHLFWPHWVSRFAEHTQQLVSWALTKEA